MNERKTIEFTNNSLTTSEQHIVVQKIASHFRIPQKMLRTAIDADSLQENVLRFPDLANVVDEEFYVVRERFKPAALINSRQFAKSQLYARLTLGQDVGGTLVLIMGSTPWVMVEYHKVSNFEGVGGFYLHHKEMGEYVVLPLIDYLRLRHPSPQE